MAAADAMAEEFVAETSDESMKRGTREGAVRHDTHPIGSV
jgi:hypothetical protein